MAKRLKNKPSERLVKVVCAWCKKPTGEQKVVRGGMEGTTHGICIPCMKAYFPEQYASLRREKRLNPDTSYDDALVARQEAIDQAQEFVSKFDEYETVMSEWTKSEVLSEAREQAMAMIRAKSALNQGLLNQAESGYGNAKEELENLTEKIGGSRY